MSHFIISLDFELLWGVRDHRGQEYHQKLIDVHNIVPKLLEIFERFEVSCTWATVGAVGVSSAEELMEMIPKKIPTYNDSNFNPFGYLDELLSLDPKLLFGSDLVRKIVNTPRQELASHTFSHFYALEDGQTQEQFSSDVKAVCTLFRDKYGVSVRSIVFPRNQVNLKYLEALSSNNIFCFRGLPRHWAYKAEKRSARSSIKRLYRLIDSYIPITLSFKSNMKVVDLGIVDVPSTLFLRPYSRALSLLEPLKIWRLKFAMSRAAKRNELFHLWWHPHNFSTNTSQNLKNLENILTHYQNLSHKYGWKNYSMAEAVEELRL